MKRTQLAPLAFKRGVIDYANMKSKVVESPRAEAFLSELRDVCRRHGLQLTYDEGDGYMVNGLDADEDVEFMGAKLAWTVSPL